MLSRVGRPRYFDAFVSAVIVANTAYTTFQSNYEMETLGEKPEGDMLAETTFLVIFVLELASKIAAHRVYFFCNDDMLWNIFDLTLVAFSALDQILSYGGASSGSVWEPPGCVSSGWFLGGGVGGRPGAPRCRERGPSDVELRKGRSGFGFGRILALSVYSTGTAMVPAWCCAGRAPLAAPCSD